ncbi:hypothetical protein HPP92_021044 [Vanilla planifolia]|uniref:Uncharacterized protein n=1 Tax=Vanilla planifolia TaxID=51239 RepID=A0A835Q0T9_VANPL|nr:hypothetical protein HPP92_021044 [Vanilla planifolia]
MALGNILEKLKRMVQRTASKLGGHRPSGTRFLDSGTGPLLQNKNPVAVADSAVEEKKSIRRRLHKLRKKLKSPNEKKEEELWRRTILMGEKCQPLDLEMQHDADVRRSASACPTLHRRCASAVSVGD